MLAIPKEQLKYTGTGRRSVLTRFNRIFGDDITVIKCKAIAKVSAQSIEGRELTPDEFNSAFGRVAYADWNGQLNVLQSPSTLIAVEANKAHSYLIFK